MNNAAIVSLDHFGFLAVSGKDAEKFMQGYTTCDLTQLPEGQVMRGAICNIKGRMLCNFLASRTEDGLLFRMHKDLVDPAIAFLSKYIVFSKAALEDKSEQLLCYGINSDALAEQEADLPQEFMQTTVTSTGQWLKIDDNRFELWTKDPLEPEASLSNWQAAELKAGVIWVDAQTTEEYIPQMFNLHNIDGISFDKGCYLGQEIVARMQYRGELKKRLHLAALEVSENVAVGSKVLSSDGKNLGNVVAQSGALVSVVIKAGEPSYQLESGTVIDAIEVGDEPQ